jgi:hypothetical protein
MKYLHGFENRDYLESLVSYLGDRRELSPIGEFSYHAGCILRYHRLDNLISSGLPKMSLVKGEDLLPSAKYQSTLESFRYYRDLQIEDNLVDADNLSDLWVMDRMSHEIYEEAMSIGKSIYGMMDDYLKVLSDNIDNMPLYLTDRRFKDVAAWRLSETK